MNSTDVKVTSANSVIDCTTHSNRYQELLRDDRFRELLRLRDELRFRGTLAPFFRASESPMAIACFLLFTFPP